MPVKSIQSPIGGINRLVSIDDTPESDAWILDNWIPDAGFCRLRGGSAMVDVDVGTDPIGTIIGYGGQLLVAAGGKVIDTGIRSDSPTLPVLPVVELGTGFANDDWQQEVFNNRLLLVNGANEPQGYDGTTLAPLDFTGSPVDLNPEEFIGVNSFKGRVIYWKDEPAFWYAEAGSFQGELTKFDLSIWVNKLTTLKIMFTWSADANDGTDDFFVALMSSGEALVYQGTDPSSLDYFAMVGTYQMGEPLSYRSSASIAGDEIVLTRDGWQNFKTVWETGNFSDNGIGRKIAGLSTTAAEQFANSSGWEVNFYPEERLVVVNVPQGSGTSIQHVMNTNTFSWCTFSGWPATTIGKAFGFIYFAKADGTLYIGMRGTSDNGAPITTDAVPAFNYLSGRANNKMLTGVKPITTMSNPDNIGLVGAGDFFVPSAETPDYSPVVVGTTPWGSPWGSPWTTVVQSVAVSQWETVHAYGYALTYRMTTVTDGENLQWGSSQIMFKDGGAI